MELEVDGRRAFAATGGRPFDPARPAIAFVHGAGGDHSVWALQTRYFAHHGFSVLAVDLPGHGRSEPPALDSVPAMAGWLLACLDAAGAKRWSLVGHSLGALVALEAAARAPRRIAALALLGVNYPMAVHDELLASAAANEHRALELISAWGHSHGAHLGRNRVPGLWMVGASLRLLERAPEGTLDADLRAAAGYRGGLDAAAGIACPTLLLLGRRDRMTRPASARALAEAIAGAQVEVLPDCGHMIMQERPDEALRALIDHVT